MSHQQQNGHPLAREISDREVPVLDPSLPELHPTPANGTRPKADFLAAETDEWASLNRRRAELIRKKHHKGLSSDELAEYERLQHLSQAALERAFPAPTVGDEALARIEARLDVAVTERK